VCAVIVFLFPRAGNIHRCPYQWISNCGSLASSTFLRPVLAQQSCNDGPAVSLNYTVLHCVCVCRDLWRLGTEMSFFQCCASPITDWIYLVAEKEKFSFTPNHVKGLPATPSCPFPASRCVIVNRHRLIIKYLTNQLVNNKILSKEKKNLIEFL
jgi:hypothetical protein